MSKKVISIGIAAVVILSALMAFLTTGVGSLFNKETVKPEEKPTVIGTWVDQSNGLDVTYTEDGIFQLQGGDVATYTIDEETGTITLKYAEAYGGEEKIMTYTVDETTLSLMEQGTGTIYQYTRKIGE